MKPTSLIFLVLSLILIFGGVMTCSVAKSMAASQNIPIYDTSFDRHGDAVFTYRVSDDTVNKLVLNFSDVDVKIVGGAASSYVELKNFDVNSYRVSLSGGTVTVDGTVGFLSSLLDMSSGGLQFKGLRHFFLDKPDPSRERCVTVYISESADLQSLSVSVKQGSVTLENIQNALDYNVYLESASATFDRVISSSVAGITCRKGDVVVNGSRFATLNATVDDGNFTVNGNNVMTISQTNYHLIVKNAGNILYNGGDAGSTYRSTAPAPESNVIVTVSNGVLTVNDGGDPPIAPNA